jgi:hypothetical protein
MSRASSAEAAYQFRVWLRGISPTIWRRFLVRSDSTIADLHYILQLVMGWTDTHLHTFVIHGKDYGIYHSGGMVFADDPTTVYLRDFQFRLHERFLYTYDFGDNWEHEVRLEKALPVVQNRSIRPVSAVPAPVPQKTAVVRWVFWPYKSTSAWDTRCTARSNCYENWCAIAAG